MKLQSKLLKGASRLHIHTYSGYRCILLLSLPLIHTHTFCQRLFFFLSASHYLLVKPMPELGEETKRHWEDYYWKDVCSHHMYPCDINTIALSTGSENEGSDGGRQGVTTGRTGHGDWLHGVMHISVITIRKHKYTAKPSAHRKHVCVKGGSREDISVIRNQENLKCSSVFYTLGQPLETRHVQM